MRGRMHERAASRAKAYKTSRFTSVGHPFPVLSAILPPPPISGVMCLDA